jgi:cell division protein FtsW
VGEYNSKKQMKRKRNHIDILILIVVLVLMVLSIGAVYSASAMWALEHRGSTNELMTRHVVSVLVALMALFVFMNIPYRAYKKLSKMGIVLAILLLLATLMIGSEIKGATRWIQIGGFNFQPSEFAKFAVLVHMCVLIERKKQYLDDWKRTLLPIAIWTAIVVGLIMLQPNFSMAAMIMLLSVIVLFLGRIPARQLAAGAVLALPAVIIYFMSAPYRLRRITGFLDSEGDTAGVSYQMSQGILAFGSGGIFGVGPGASRQRDFFLPESYGDYVFAIFGEEWGFIGAAVVILIFAFIFLRGFRIALNIEDDFGKLLAGAMTIAISSYAVINSMVTTGLLPTTGLPMPFLSYGGTAMIANAAAIGILLNISSYTSLRPKEENAHNAAIHLNRVQ